MLLISTRHALIFEYVAGHVWDLEENYETLSVGVRRRAGGGGIDRCGIGSGPVAAAPDGNEGSLLCAVLQLDRLLCRYQRRLRLRVLELERPGVEFRRQWRHVRRPDRLQLAVRPVLLRP